MSSSALRWPGAEAAKEVKKRTCSKIGRNVEFEGQNEKTDGREPALLTMLM